MKKPLKKIKKKLKAFTLIESLVSIAIILIALIGPLSLILNSLNSIIENKNRIVASYLAEELVEDLRSFRDGYDIACGDIKVTHDNNSGAVIGGTCDKNGASINVLSTYLTGENGEADFTNRDVSWKLFLSQLSGKLGVDLYLDKNSFDYNDLTISPPNQNCYLSLDSNNGYVYRPNNSDLFCRVANLTKIGDNALKVEVSVRYVRSSLFGLSDKYVKVIDYIYER